MLLGLYQISSLRECYQDNSAPVGYFPTLDCIRVEMVVNTKQQNIYVYILIHNGLKKISKTCKSVRASKQLKQNKPYINFQDYVETYDNHLPSVCPSKSVQLWWGVEQIKALCKRSKGSAS